MRGPTPSSALAQPPVRRLAADPGTLLAFSGRALGNVSLVAGDGEAPADVAAARTRLAGLVGLEPADVVLMEQIHGPGVAVVGLADRGRGVDDHARAVPGVDALVTTDPDVGLVVLVADCVPLLLAAPGRGVAAVHAGRAGVASGVVGAAVAVLAQEARVAPWDLVGVVGPAIGGCCYEVPAALQLEVVLVAPAARATTSGGTPSLDLPAAVVQQATAAGVRHLTALGGCTRCDPGSWFSHRATTGATAPAGRQAGIVRMGAAPPGNGAPPSLDFG